MDPRDLRNCYGHFATGVTVVTWNNDEGDRKGITINSFTSVSLDPPLVLISIDKNTNALKDLKDRPFVINILAADQKALAHQFAGKQQDGLEVEWEEDSSIGPRLKDTIGTIECKPWAEYEGGDHVLFVGEVAEYSYREDDGLIFHKGKFLKAMSNSVMNY